MNAFWDKLRKEDKKEKKGKKVSDVDADEQKDDKTGKEVKKKKETTKDKKNQVVDKKKKKKKKKAFPKEKAVLIERIIVRPKVSESAMRQQSLGKYVFYASMDSTKSEIAKAVEAMYGVHVTKVNIQRYSQRAHQFRGFKGLKKGSKKAIVTLNKGESIDVFSE